MYRGPRYLTLSLGDPDRDRSLRRLEGRYTTNRNLPCTERDDTGWVLYASLVPVTKWQDFMSGPESRTERRVWTASYPAPGTETPDHAHRLHGPREE